MMKDDLSRLQLRVKKLGNYIFIISYFPIFVNTIWTNIIRFIVSLEYLESSQYL